MEEEKLLEEKRISENSIELTNKDLKNFLSEEILDLIWIKFKECDFKGLATWIKGDIIELIKGIYSYQIISSIYIFSLLKIQNFEEASSYLNELSKKVNRDQWIFPLRFLECKYLFLINDINKSLKYLYKLLNTYIRNNENAIEEYPEFSIFNDFFNNMFEMGNIDNQRKKIFFEIKNCFLKMNLHYEAWKIIEKVYCLYPDDLIVMYEFLKQSIYIGDFSTVEEVYMRLKNLFFNCNEENKVIFENYLNFAEALICISKNDYELAKNKMTEILKNNPDNIIIVNNVALLNLYLNRVDKTYIDLKLILDKDQLNCFNETTFSNINILTDYVSLPKYNLQ